jgi:hypothetical protein
MARQPISGFKISAGLLMLGLAGSRTAIVGIDEDASLTDVQALR